MKSSLATEVILTTLLLAIPFGHAVADSGASFREPSDMTVEERTGVMQRVNDYNNCVFREAMARVDRLPDIRQAADEGMAACKAALETIGKTLTDYRFEPGFSTQFLHHTQSRAVRMLIPELSLRKAGN